MEQLNQHNETTLNLAYSQPSLSSTLNNTTWLNQDLSDFYLESSEFSSSAVDMDVSMLRCAPYSENPGVFRVHPEMHASPKSIKSQSVGESFILVASENESESETLERFIDPHECPPHMYIHPSFTEVSNRTINEALLKPYRCSLTRHLIESVSDRLENCKKRLVKNLRRLRPVKRPVSTQVDNKKLGTATPTTNVSSATVVLVNRRSKFYATPNQLGSLATSQLSPMGLKNFEWNRLDCGEFFSYNV